MSTEAIQAAADAYFARQAGYPSNARIDALRQARERAAQQGDLSMVVALDANLAQAHLAQAEDSGAAPERMDELDHPAFRWTHPNADKMI